MIDVVSIKFKNRGKSYYFAPNGLTVKTGQKVIVETAKGLEIADCVRGNHPVEETGVIQPLRNVLRIATEADLRVAENNKRREREAYRICQQKIEEHKLDMKLVDVECNFEGNKTMFFFTSDGRVDFRELVKDLAGIFRNRIELRQIGVRDEAKMLGGIGICGRPYCCSQFLDDFQPVSTKMAKIQSLSLNPTKISGSCGRLMCCLRYEQEAYEELIKKVPKQGAFVETKDGYGTAVQVNLLRQTVKVRLDDSGDDTLHSYTAGELAAVPGGRPRDGSEPPHVLNYVEPEPEPVEEEKESADSWMAPVLVVPEVHSEQGADSAAEGQKSRRRRRRRSGKGGDKAETPAETPKSADKPKAQNAPKADKARNGAEGGRGKNQPRTEGKKNGEGKSRSGHKTVKVEAKPASEVQAQKAPEGAREGSQAGRSRHRRRRPKSGGEAKPTGE